MLVAQKLRSIAACLISVLLFLGCGGPNGKLAKNLAPVSGRILMDKKPLANAEVRFAPEDRTSSSSAITDSQGNYKLTVEDSSNREGAVIGDHRVEISIDERRLDRPPSSPKGPRELIPKKYNAESILTFSVKPGDNKADFDISSK
jgi:hypothetical protein